MDVEVIDREGIRYAEVIWRDTVVDHTTFYSPASSSFQFGLLAHEAGYAEDPHSHRSTVRQIDDLQQMLVVQRGVVAVELFTDAGAKFREVVLREGDAIVLIHGIHAIRVIEDLQCLTVKQGPFLGAEHDRVSVTRRA